MAADFERKTEECQTPKNKVLEQHSTGVHCVDYIGGRGTVCPSILRYFVKNSYF